MGKIIYVHAAGSIHPEPTGVEVYCTEIIKALLALPQAAEHRWILLAPTLPPAGHTLASLPKYATWKVLPGKRLWTAVTLSRFFGGSHQKDILFVPGYVLPYQTPLTTVLTVHDFAFRYFPEAYSIIQRTLMDININRSVRKATHLIVPSDATRQDLQTLYGTPPTKITVVPHGIDQTIFHAAHGHASVEIARQQPYFLVLGRLETRKNIVRILQAFHKICTTNTSHHLVVLGKPGVGWHAISEYLEVLPIAVRQRIDILNTYQNQSALLNWLQHAQVLVYPSLYEGFGFPILEAMASHVPVITSNTSSLIEVADHAAELVDPENSDELAAAMEKLATNADRRQELIQRGIERAHRFTWEEAAVKTFDVLVNTR